MITVEELKRDTKIGDKYQVFYHGVTPTKDSTGNFIIHEITRFNDKSVWFGRTRESWNTVKDYINKNVYRKVSFLSNLDLRQ